MALKPVIGHWGAAVHPFTSGLILEYAGLPAARVLAGLLGLTESGTRPGLHSRIGDASYSIYLSHTFTIDAVELPRLRARCSPGQGRLAPRLGLKPPAPPPGPRAP